MMQDHAAALQHLDRAISLNPDYSQADNNRGVALMRAGRTRAAARAFGRAVTDPHNAQARYNLATAQRAVKATGRGTLFEEN